MHLPPSVFHGVAIGLWALAGLSYLVRALLPGSAAQGIAGPLLLAAAVAWTALLPTSAAARPAGAPPRRLPVLLLLLGGLLAAGTALAIVSEGDRRSFLFIGFTVVAVLTLTVQLLRKGEET